VRESDEGVNEVLLISLQVGGGGDREGFMSCIDGDDAFSSSDSNREAATLYPETGWHGAVAAVQRQVAGGAGGDQRGGVRQPP
jgi:hypothetical protein